MQCLLKLIGCFFVFPRGEEARPHQAMHDRQSLIPLYLFEETLGRRALRFIPVERFSSFLPEARKGC